MQTDYFHPQIEEAGLELQIRRVRENQKLLASRSTEEIILLLDAFGNALSTSDWNQIEGLAFLSLWLRKQNLSKLLEVSFGSREEALDAFLHVHRIHLRAAPRGLIGHWIAGNIPTLSLFSFALSVLAKNGNLVRVSQSCIQETSLLLSALADVQLHQDGKTLSGKSLLDSACFFHFPSDDVGLNRKLSLACDARVIWGGPEAVQEILQLPRPEHSEDIIFGPKFSIVVVDRPTLESVELQEKLATSLVRETIMFDQQACSSPQIVFLEGDWAMARDFARRVEKEFARRSDIRPKQDIGESSANRILAARSEYAMSDHRDVFAAMDLNHTVFLDSDIELTEGLQSRSLFLRVVPSLFEIIPLLSPKIQTIGIAISDDIRRLEFCEQAAKQGVSRCVHLGIMNAFDIPWDGMNVLDRMVRWVVLHV